MSVVICEYSCYVVLDCSKAKVSKIEQTAKTKGDLIVEVAFRDMCVIDYLLNRADDECVLVVLIWHLVLLAWPCSPAVYTTYTHFA